MGSRGMTRSTLRATALALAVVVLTSCGSGGDVDLDDDAAWRTSTDPVDTSGLVWANGSTVHLPDDVTVDTGEPVRAFLPAGDGVFFVPEDEVEPDRPFTDAPLWFVAPGGASEDTGLTVDERGGVAVSPDGRFLVVLDADYDEGSATMRIFDLDTGEAIESEDGMDTSGIDDPVDHLLESEVEILAITDEEVTARVIEGDVTYDLATGEGTEADDSAGVVDPLVSPDGAWRIDESVALRELLVSESGEQVVPDAGTERWGLTTWVDATTVLGYAVAGPGEGGEVGPDNTLTMITCTVPDGACTQVEGTTDQRLLLPLGTRPTYELNLTTPEAGA